MKELVDYTEADVGALFILEDKENAEAAILKLYGSYAFDREKHKDASFGIGEGLVGRAALEKESIYITDLPPDYMKIRSGLGEDVPSSLLLIPVLLDNNVLGVIELASLGEIPQHQITFIQVLSEALATTLAKIQANLQTQQLFEHSKKEQEEYAIREKKLLDEIDRLRLELTGK
jgi:methyl-accepting chemotaxis protein